jgi:hypothetical protein
MLRFPLARLLDEPELSILNFYPDNRPTQRIDSKRYQFTIYVVRNGDDIFYVGKSDDDCFVRLRSHLGCEFRGKRSVSSLGELVLRNLPEAREWSVEFYTNAETKRVVPRRFYEGFVDWPTEYAELAMIQTLRPCLNVKLNSLHPHELPAKYK